MYKLSQILATMTLIVCVLASVPIMRPEARAAPEFAHTFSVPIDPVDIASSWDDLGTTPSLQKHDLRGHQSVVEHEGPARLQQLGPVPFAPRIPHPELIECFVETLPDDSNTEQPERVFSAEFCQCESLRELRPTLDRCETAKVWKLMRPPSGLVN